MLLHYYCGSLLSLLLLSSLFVKSLLISISGKFLFLFPSIMLIMRMMGLRESRRVFTIYKLTRVLLVLSKVIKAFILLLCEEVNDLVLLDSSPRRLFL
jgi:hypothetical protein